MGVKKSAYRQPVTPEGLKAIEKGTLTWLDDEMYNNLNTGLLEQYLEEKNLEEAFEVSHWDTKKVLMISLLTISKPTIKFFIGSDNSDLSSGTASNALCRLSNNETKSLTKDM